MVIGRWEQSPRYRWEPKGIHSDAVSGPHGSYYISQDRKLVGVYYMQIGMKLRVIRVLDSTDMSSPDILPLVWRPVGPRVWCRKLNTLAGYGGGPIGT